ncbi:MAG: hypothetical protein LBV75_01575 [Paludibacter sp.]|nr:hypothetical protein [Paludibacter sp.]
MLSRLCKPTRCWQKLMKFCLIKTLKINGKKNAK